MPQDLNRSRFSRIFLSIFFLCSALLKAEEAFGERVSLDLIGFTLPTWFLILAVTMECSLALLLLSRFWRIGSSLATVLFACFLCLAGGELLGLFDATEHCGCFGRIRVETRSRFLLSLGGGILAMTSLTQRSR